MGNNKVANVIRHLAFEDLGSFESVLSVQGWQVNYIEAGCDELDQLDALSDDLLIILGGPISVNDSEMFAFIDIELELIKQRIDNDRPVLGICLGAQLIAKALGSRVYPAREKEIGWYDIQLTQAGEDSALRYLDAKHCSVLHWHGETFDLPDGAVLLASSERCINQAFSAGKNILALQFHPEVTQHGMERWFIGHIGEIMQTEDVSVKGLRDDTRQYCNRLEMQAELFFNSWLNQIT
jgi:GMP synthase (glutamine-hydrolysing)